MKTRAATFLRVVFMFVLWVATYAKAQVFNADFSTTTLDPSFGVDHEVFHSGIFYGDYLPGSGPHWSVTTGQGLLNISLEPTDQPYSSLGPRVKTISTFAGDFVAEITIDGSASNGSSASIQMKAPDPWSVSSLTWAGVLVSQGNIGFFRKGANYYGKYVGEGVAFDLRLSRIGQTISAEYRPIGAADYELLISSTDAFLGGLADPVWFELRNSAYGITESSTASFGNFTVSPIPEPSAYAALMGSAAVGLVVWRRKRRRQ
jgi:hypothetical protein